MDDKQRPDDAPDRPDPQWPDQRIGCAQCLREIPKSEALVSEAQDYVLYFCGIECFGEWRRRAENPAGKK